MISWNLISIIVFYWLIALFFIKHRHRISVQGRILFLYRTEEGLNFIRRLAQRFKAFFRAFGYIAIPVGFGGLFIILAFLTLKAFNIFTAKVPPTAGVALAIPGVRIPGSPLFIPFWYGIIALIIIIAVHESAHGLVAKAHGLKLKSAGVGLLAVLPIAFVEPDEEQLRKQSIRTQLSVFAAGPFANICTALVAALVGGFLIAPIAAAVVDPAGIYVVDTMADFPAAEAGLQNGDLILSIDGQPVNMVEDFAKAMAVVTPNQSIELTTSRGSMAIRTTSDPQNASRAYIGVSFKQNFELKDQVAGRFGTKLPWSPFYLFQLLNWIFVLNLGIGVVNLLPLGPIDGGRMVKVCLERAMKNKVLINKIFIAITAFSLTVLILNLIGPYLMRLFI